MLEQPTNETALSAVTILSDRLRYLPVVPEDLKQAKRAIDSLGGMGLVNKSQEVGTAVLLALGDFVGKRAEEKNRESTRALKMQALDVATAVGVKSEDEKVRAAAIAVATKELNTLEFNGDADAHISAVLCVGSVAMNATEPVKVSALEALRDYLKKSSGTLIEGRREAFADAKDLSMSVVAVLGT